MKKLLLVAILIFTLAIPSAIAKDNTLYEFFNGNLPTITTRAKMAATAGITDYRGTYSQNVSLLAWLQDKGDKLGSNTPSSGVSWTLSAPITLDATTIYLTAVTDIRGNVIASSSLPTKVYFTIEPNSTSNAEIIVCPVSGYTAASKVFTGCTRGLAFSGSSEAAVTANQKAHASGATIVMSNVGQFYNNFVDTDSAQTIDGIKTYVSYPRIQTYAAPTVDEQFSPKKYVDDTINAGAAVGTEATAGIWKGASKAESALGTSSRGGYNLLLQSQYATSTSQVATTSIPITNTSGKIDTSFIDQTANYDWSGTNSFTGTTAMATTTFNIGNSVDIFSGDGSDGAFNATAGATTTISAGSANIVIKNYTSINIPIGATTTLSNKADGGTILIMKSQGDCTIAGQIYLQGMGANGGTAGTAGVDGGNGGAGGDGTENAIVFDETADHAGNLGAGGTTGTGGAAGAAGAIYGNKLFYTTPSSNRLIRRWTVIAVGSGGAGGGGGQCTTNPAVGAAGGVGGAGGGTIIIQCGGYLSFTGSININGENGAKGEDVNVSNGGGGGGGGGGASGMALVLYNNLIANTGTITALGGAAGAGGADLSGTGTDAAGGGGGSGAGNYTAAGGAGGAGGNGNANGSAGDAGGGIGSGGGGGGGSGAKNTTGTGGAGGAGGADATSNYLIAKNNWY
jgi:hypothetical protein